MKCTFACKKVSLNDSIKEYTEKKVSKLDRYFQEEPAAFVTFSVEKNHLCTVELTIRGGNTIFRAQTQETDGDMRSAVDAAISYIERADPEEQDPPFQAHALRGFPRPRRDGRFQRGGGEGVRHRAHQALLREAHERRGGHPQMNLLDHDFFVFRGAEDGALSIVYRRKNGGYGLIETGEEE